LELLRTHPSNEDLLPLLRTMQRTMLEDHGVVFGEAALFGPQNEDGPPEGYDGIGQELVARFPTDDWRVNREIARILAYLEPAGAAEEIAAALHDPDLDREQQIALADALSFVESGWDDATMDLMIGWLGTVYSEEWRGGRQFMSYIDLIRDSFLDHIPDEVRPLAAERIEASKPAVAEGPGGFGGRLNLSPLSQEELEEELVFNPRNFEGEFEAGAWAYEKAYCITCHTFGPIGREVGPDLTTINQRFNRQDLVTAVMHPSETISDLWQMEAVTKTNGEVVSGTVTNETAQEVVVQIPAGPQVTIPKADIASRARSEVSPMPEGLLNYLNGNEQRALLMLLEAGPDAIPDSALTRINGS
jgi:putative heme-binding domain-containing protein